MKTLIEALIGKKNQQNASSKKGVKWFLVIPYTAKCNYGDYPDAYSLDGYSVRIFTYKQFHDLYFKSGWKDNDGDVFVVKYNLSIEEVSELISSNTLNRKRGMPPKEFERINASNIIDEFR